MPDLLARVAALPGVEEAATAARRAVDGLLAERTLRQKSVPVIAEIALRDARASALLEGAPPLDLEDLRARVENAPESDSGHPLDWRYRGALRAAAALAELSPAWERAPRQAIARVHVLAARDAGGDQDALGRPRPDPAVLARLDALVEALSAPTSAPAVVVAAVVHAELLSLGPFGDGDGIVARAAARLVLHSRGVDPKGVSAPDVGHLEDPAAYTEALAGYRAGDVAGWVLHCCAAVTRGAAQGREVCSLVARGGAA